nr:hypothetical protein [Tanacetum cinerariifolium]
MRPAMAASTTLCCPAKIWVDTTHRNPATYRSPTNHERNIKKPTIITDNHKAGFLDSGGRNNNQRKKTTTDIGTCSTLDSDGIQNDVTPRVDAAMKVVLPFVVVETVAMECLVANTPDVGRNPPLPMHEANYAGNALGNPSYSTATCKPSGKKVNVHTLFTPEGNRIHVVVLVDSIRAISERFANTTYGFFLGKKVAYLVVANYIRNTWGKYRLVRSMFSSYTGLFSFQFSSIEELGAMLENGPWSSYAKVMVELRADVELKDNIVVAMPRITREGHYTCMFVLSISENPLGVHLVRFLDISMRNVKPQKEYRPITKKPNASSSGYMKNGVVPTVEAVGDDGNPLVPTGIVKTDSDVKVVFDDTANLGISTSDNDDYDPCDDDMYENHDLSEHLQSICDDLDITIRGRKKK